MGENPPCNANKFNTIKVFDLFQKKKKNTLRIIQLMMWKYWLP